MSVEDSYVNAGKPRICETIRDFSYVGIFPMSSHFSTFIDNFPRLDRLYVQFVPRNDTLQNPSKVAHVSLTDLWMERNGSYSLLMREIFTTPPRLNFAHLQVFESGDAADKDAWGLAADFISRANNGWKVTGDGVVERDPKYADPRRDTEGEEEGFQLSVSQPPRSYQILIEISQWRITDQVCL